MLPFYYREIYKLKHWFEKLIQNVLLNSFRWYRFFIYEDGWTTSRAIVINHCWSNIYNLILRYAILILNLDLYITHITSIKLKYYLSIFHWSFLFTLHLLPIIFMYNHIFILMQIILKLSKTIINHFYH